MDDRPWLRRMPQDPMRGWDGFRSTHNPEVRRFESYPHYQGKQGRPLWRPGPFCAPRNACEPIGAMDLVPISGGPV